MFYFKNFAFWSRIIQNINLSGKYALEDSYYDEIKIYYQVTKEVNNNNPESKYINVSTETKLLNTIKPIYKDVSTRTNLC